MKKVDSILEASLMTMIYCLALLSVVSHHFSAGSTSSDYSSEVHPSYVSADAIDLFFHAAQVEISSSVVNSNVIPNFKNQFQGFSAILLHQEIIFGSAFHQYHSTFTNLLIRFRKANLIFPFHDFW